MKSKSVEGIARTPRDLTFAWTRGDEALVRFWVALVLASGIFLVLWFSVGVVVPAAMAPDRARVDSAQLIIVTEDSDPSLKALVGDKSLPAMGGQVLEEAPMLDGMLSLLGLQEEAEHSVRPYPEWIESPHLDWPKVEQSEFTLPPLPAMPPNAEQQMAEATALEWEVTLKGKGKLGKFFEGKVMPWSGVVPAIRSSVWSVVVDEEGTLAFAGALESEDAQLEKLIRKKLQQLFGSAYTGEGDLSGMVELKFEKKGG